MLYFFLLEAAFFQGAMRAALARGFRERSFRPCEELIRTLVARVPDVPPDALLRGLRPDTPFQKHLWQALVGECLLLAAVEIPRFQTAPDALCSLLAPDSYPARDLPRPLFPPIWQAHFGSSDLIFAGGYYRPDQAGVNDEHDVLRLLEYLRSVDTALWTAADLARLPDLTTNEDRAEELALVRDCWPDLIAMYERAAANNCVIVCETV